MAILRCKMCGGDLEIIEGSSSCTCEFCGTVQTIPTVKDEGLKTLFNRANVLRMKSEFDKASEMYEKILQKSESESEAYWGLILCKYGIEYVEDPNTYKRIPTCHRASFDAVTSDEDYKNALKYADVTQRKIYEEEAKAIDEVQKGIIALAQKEDPYDVFICYKETDENGNRTQDSVIANDIYYQLTQEGFKVFYAAITLEDKLGSEYEPHIFSALNTAKVMLSLGTKPEYFNAVWVKNEWSRFLKIMKKDRSKMLIPCYRDMDAYELPEEFSHLQAQDMSKIGFITDLIRGIKKVIVKEKATPATQETVVVQQTTGSTTAIAQIKRGNMALEDQDWAKADSFFEEALNLDPECAEAYMGKLLARDKKTDLTSWVEMQKGKKNECVWYNEETLPEEKLHVDEVVLEYVVPGYLDENTVRKEYEFDRDYCLYLSEREDQKESQLSELASDRLLTRVKQYAKNELKKQIDDALDEISKELEDRIQQAREEDEERISRLKTEYAAFLKTADVKVRELSEEARDLREQDYQSAVDLMEKADTLSAYEEAMRALEAMNGYKESAKLVDECQVEIDRLNMENQKEQERQIAIEKEKLAHEQKKRNIRIIIIAIIAIVCISAIFVVSKVIIPKQKFIKAMNMIDSGEYDAAYALLEEIGNSEVITSNKYDRAVNLINSGEYDSAYALLEEIGNREAITSNKYDRAVNFINSGEYDSAYALLEEIGKSETIASSKYDRAVEYIDTGDYASAFTLLNGLMYRECLELLESIKPQYYKVALANASVGDTVYFGAFDQDNDVRNGKENIEWIVLAKEDGKILVISKYAHEGRGFNSSNQYITWEKCTLRHWLNDTFLNSAFSVEEQAQIAITDVINEKNEKYGTSGGDSTTDKIFLLSIAEAERYFTSDAERQCEPTDYAIANGTYVDSDNANCVWWLRSSGMHQNSAAGVSTRGVVEYSGYGVGNTGTGVRPAMWINLENN